MLALLSPAKKLLSIAKPYADETSKPLLLEHTVELAKIMKTKSEAEIAKLMDLSADLAKLNYTRYQEFAFESPKPEHSYPALFLFQGDVYRGLEAKSWDKNTLAYAQDHLAMLSGLYGYLRPLDRIQPYRLEMGVKLKNQAGNNLYEFWRDAIAQVVNQHLAKQKNPVLLNLASNEYFNVINEKAINYPIVTVNFYENKNNELKIIGIHAKKARGTMAKFIMQHQIDSLEDLKSFNELGYSFNPKISTEKHFDFIRSC